MQMYEQCRSGNQAITMITKLSGDLPETIGSKRW
nr:MAG TPA: hypothetical protein [Caudoviricetes sp.]